MSLALPGACQFKLLFSLIVFATDFAKEEFQESRNGVIRLENLQGRLISSVESVNLQWLRR